MNHALVEGQTALFFSRIKANKAVVQQQEPKAAETDADRFMREAVEKLAVITSRVYGQSLDKLPVAA